jgi:hypothetical protein
MDSIIRIVGAISLWSVEIVMQLRIYALFKCSKKVCTHAVSRWGRATVEAFPLGGLHKFHSVPWIHRWVPLGVNI